ncbi:MAG: EpsG family protein [Eubacterium sp.]|nr:EpsG family protein [Eubacterium sp.]
MTVYYIFIASVFIFAYLSQISDRALVLEGESKKVKHSAASQFWFLLIVLMMILISGFRYQVGADFGAYYKMYEEFADIFVDHLKQYKEPGFYFICWIVTRIGGNGTTVLMICAVLTVCLSIYPLYRRTSEVLLFALLYVFLGCWHEGLNAVRQCLAMAVLCLGFDSLKERKFFKYLIIVLLAGAFHRSALLMIAAYFLVNWNINFKNTVILFAASTALLFSFDSVFGFSESLLETDYSLEYNYISTNVNILRILVAVAPAVFFLIVFSKRGFDEEQRFNMNLVLMNAAIMVAASNSTYLARMGIYTAPFVAVAFPELLKDIEFKNRRLITSVIVLLYFAFWWYDIYNNPSLNDFTFVWQYS